MFGIITYAYEVEYVHFKDKITYSHNYTSNLH